MKKKIIFIAVILLCISIIAMLILTKKSNKVENVSLNNKSIEELQNTIKNEFNVNSNIIVDDNTTVDNKFSIENNIITEDVSVIENEQSKTEEITEVQPKQSNNINSKNDYFQNNINDQINENIEENVPESEPEPQPQIEKTETEPVEENQQPSIENHEEVPVQQQNTPYWCVDGGTHHIEGDEPNEHGYYSSWDEAYRAYEDYTKDWTSFYNYKIDSCACGQYYFWVQQ